MPQIPGFLAACLAVSAFVATAVAQVALRVDVNDPGSPADTAADHAAYSLSGDTLFVPPFSVDINPATGAALDTFHRATPVNGGALTLGALYRDGVVAAGTTGTNYYRTGIDTVIGGLIPGKRYNVKLWSYDSGATGTPASDWSILGLKGPQFIAHDYSFTPGTPPANDSAYTLSVNAYADASGQLVLRGRQSAPLAEAQVFLNGFTLEPLPGAAVEPATVLAVDFNARTAAGGVNTMSGFSEFILDAGTPADTMRTISGRRVTVTGVNLPLDDRNRTTPLISGQFNEAQLMRDFIFARANANPQLPNETQGLDVLIRDLSPGQTYLLELWCFDSGSGGPRPSDWTANGQPLWTGYTFNGNILPTSNNDYKMVTVVTASGTGEILINGRHAPPFSAANHSVFINALRLSEFQVSSIVDLGRPIISEFMADNKDSVTDEDGDNSDWIEIWNTTADTLDLAGWHLTDDPANPTKWTFPAGVTIPSQGRLIVWASGKNRKTNPAALHTNFALSRQAGSYLALRQPGGAIVATEFSDLPFQPENVSYGLTGTEDPLTAGFFTEPTPGGPNGVSVPGFVADTKFSVDRGFYNAPFNVEITTATEGATIRYTTDGSDPTESSPAYPGGSGIPITTTTVLRARAFKPPLAASNTDTHTYIFRAHVQNQPANPPGWPATWGTDSEVGTVPSNYEMDPNVVNTTQPGYSVLEALEALPVLSVVMNPADFHNAGSGIYTNPKSTGDSWERACSIEILELNGSDFHTRCGIRVHGNSSRRPARMQKHSFRLSFRNKYGDGKLNYPLYENSKVDAFNKLVLHAFFTDGFGLVSWDAGRYRPQTALCMRDAFMKMCFADMGYPLVAGRYSHLFINGLYWGIYRIGERVDDRWCADHLGGAPEDWDVIAFGEPDYVRAGTAAAWDSLFSLVNSADLTVPANYNNVAQQLDLENFIDYYLLHVHGDAEDWPHHNGYAIRNRVAPGAKWKHIVWDQEISFDPQVLMNKLSLNTDKTPARLLQRLRVNPEFRLLFADRAHKHLNNNGALSLAVEQARWQALADQLDKAIVAESARWGDTADETPYGTSIPAGTVIKRETHWLPNMLTVKNNHFPALHNRANPNGTIKELLDANLWPATEPPVFGQFGGNVPVGFALTMSAPAGTIYYTVDGSDPRQAVSGNPVGTQYTAGVTLNQTTVVKARALNAGVWSALTEATFIVGVAASADNLAVSELHYNPATNPDEEFIELVNKSNDTIDLTGVHFVAGVTFTFPNGMTLGPGERILVVRDVAAFTAKYGPGLPVAGQYEGALDGAGEQVALAAANGADIFRFTYDDAAPWPTAADGGGYSLVLRNPNSDPSDPANWRSSSLMNGNPGVSDRVAFAGDPLADDDGDGLAALLEYCIGTSDAEPSQNGFLSMTIANHQVNGVVSPYVTLTVRRELGADDATLVAEVSSDLVTWSSAPEDIVFLGETIQLDGSAVLQWRAAQPATSSSEQFFRLKATLAP